MDTEQIVRDCGWRFYAGRYLNAARIGTDGSPFSAAMTIKGFFSTKLPASENPETVRSILRSAIVHAYPEMAWKFGKDTYDPHQFSYDAAGELKPFDYARDVDVEFQASDARSIWDFVEQQCELDESSPQVFGEAVRCRFTMGPDGAVFGRMTFNHALVDGLMIFKFLGPWERALERQGAPLADILSQESTGRRSWQTRQIRYSVEEFSSDRVPELAIRGFSYLPILYEISKGRAFTRIRQAIAVPRKSMIQLAIAPVRKAFGYEKFQCLNLEEIRKARNGTRLSAMLDEYRKDPEEGDRYIRRLISMPVIGKWMAGSLAGDMMVSSFMFKHPRYLAFPVVHPFQREGVAICNLWEKDGQQIARITRVRNMVR